MADDDPMTISVDERRLRHPAERPTFVVTVLLNLALIGGALALAAFGGDWLERHPRVAKYADGLRAAAIAAVLAPVVLTFSRNRRHAAVRGNAVQLSHTQLPEIYDDFEQMCATLGMQPPELYVTDRAIAEPSAAYSAWHVDYVVLNSRFLEAKLDDVRDVYRFYLARELGRIHLGHTGWVDDILIAHVTRTPMLGNPLMHMRTYSHDRYAAYLAPDSIRGLIVQASGRRMLKRVDVQGFLRQARDVRGWWARAASLGRDMPRVAYRIQELDRAGLLRRTATVADASAEQPVPPSAHSFAAHGDAGHRS